MVRATNDWRLGNGGEYLKNLVFSWNSYTYYSETWEHDDCELWFAKFV